MASSISPLEVPTGIVSITPHASNDLTKPIRAFMVTGGGAVDVVMADGTTGIYPGCIPGVMYQGSIYAVRTTNTTATGIIGFY